VPKLVIVVVPVMFKNTEFCAPMSVVVALAKFCGVPWLNNCSHRKESPVADPAPSPVSLFPVIGRFPVTGV
jgi:hypothetical protein